MKNLFLSILLGVVFYSGAAAQLSTSYYPLEVGNYWEYWGVEYGKIVKFRSSVIGDTLMPNGKKYFAVYSRFYEYSETLHFYRMEGDSVLYEFMPALTCEGMESTLYNFKAKDSTIWRNCGRYDWDSTRTYYIGVAWTFRQGYSNLGINYAINVKEFESVILWTKDGVTRAMWDPIDGIGNIYIAQGLGLVAFIGELSPFWQLEGAIIHGKRYGTITGVEDHTSGTKPEDLRLLVYPNPFNSSSRISLSLPSGGEVRLCMFDMLGRKVKTIYEGELIKGSYSFSIEAGDLASGTYVLNALANSKTISKKIILMK